MSEANEIREPRTEAEPSGGGIVLVDESSIVMIDESSILLVHK
ncbi:MAG: hypothetical protein WDZ59_11875 [Pirellulales bacterium]